MNAETRSAEVDHHEELRTIALGLQEVAGYLELPETLDYLTARKLAQTFVIPTRDLPIGQVLVVAAFLANAAEQAMAAAIAKKA